MQDETKMTVVQIDCEGNKPELRKEKAEQLVSLLNTLDPLNTAQREVWLKEGELKKRYKRVLFVLNDDQAEQVIVDQVVAFAKRGDYDITFYAPRYYPYDPKTVGHEAML